MLTDQSIVRGMRSVWQASLNAFQKNQIVMHLKLQNCLQVNLEDNCQQHKQPEICILDAFTFYFENKFEFRPLVSVHRQNIFGYVSCRVNIHRR